MYPPYIGQYKLLKAFRDVRFGKAIYTYEQWGGEARNTLIMALPITRHPILVISE